MNTDPASPGASAPERPGLVATYRRLWPYLWPHGRPDLQRRVFFVEQLPLAGTNKIDQKQLRHWVADGTLDKNKDRKTT